MLKLRKIAVTGGVSSGKSTVCGILKELGAFVISADEIAHQLLSPHTLIGKKVIEVLGSGIVSQDRIDRKKVADLVFSHPEKLEELEKIIHPAVYQEMERWYTKIQNKKNISLFVAEIPLYYESKPPIPFDLVITVAAEPSLCLQRLQQKNPSALEDFALRMKRQIPLQKKREQADFVIDNNGSLEELNQAVRNIVINLQKEPFSP